jgi:SAM-dependent methyltransferase
MAQFETVVCDGCGEHEHTVEYGFAVAGTDARIVRCRSCGLAYLSPRPTAAALPEFYRDTYYAFSPSENPAHLSRKERLRRGILRNHFGYTQVDGMDVPKPLSAALARFMVMPTYQPGGRVLDVGCGAGDRLVDFRAFGWGASGIEISAQAVAAGRARGLDIHAGSLEDAPWPPASFSTICFYHSLEHMPSPSAALRKAFELLRPGGELLVAVPNYGCSERRLFGAAWDWLQVPIHFYHFDKRSLPRIVGAAGFSALRLEYSFHGRSATVRLPGLPKRLAGMLQTAVNLLAIPCAAMGDGKALTLTAQRPALPQQRPEPAP